MKVRKSFIVILFQLLLLEGWGIPASAEWGPDETSPIDSKLVRNLVDASDLVILGEIVIPTDGKLPSLIRIKEVLFNRVSVKLKTDEVVSFDPSIGVWVFKESSDRTRFYFFKSQKQNLYPWTLLSEGGNDSVPDSDEGLVREALKSSKRGRT